MLCLGASLATVSTPCVELKSKVWEERTREKSMYWSQKQDTKKEKVFDHLRKFFTVRGENWSVKDKDVKD